MAEPHSTGRRKRIEIRSLHRILGSIIVLFALYLGVTGCIVQLIDLRAILTHAPAADPTMTAIRESMDGPPSYAVIQTQDYAAAPLNAGFVIGAAFRRVMRTARAVAQGKPVRFVELRVIGGRTIGRVLAGGRLLQFDASSGQRLPDLMTRPSPGAPPSSAHLLAKRWHRMWALGDGMLWLNALIGIGLFVMIVTGLRVYWKLMRARARIGRQSLFWSAGGWLKTFHRSVALVAALFLMEVSFTGTALSLDSFALQIYKSTHLSQLINGQIVAGMVGDYSSPLSDRVIMPMVKTSLAAYRAEEGARPIKVLRLRYFAGMPQGVIVTGGRETRQLVFNAASGARASMTEPGYPYMGFPTGWELHELLKRIHRGDVLGVTGRLMDLFAGLSLVFLSATGLWMYLDLWLRRRRAGRKALLWY